MKLPEVGHRYKAQITLTVQKTFRLSERCQRTRKLSILMRWLPASVPRTVTSPGYKTSDCLVRNP